ncbi:hypothetical protein [Lysinibacillus xylanilyticus]|uniref:hypothetical protein n=1 Tax=Lysinibacillus xylanilyticus TaxID=582475 RepID=UPI003D01F3AC
MDTLLIYDELGHFISATNRTPSTMEPVGVPFMWIDVPDGKIIKVDSEGIAVDVSVTPHTVELEDVSRSPEYKELQDKIADLHRSQADQDELLMQLMLTTGGN